MRLPDHKGGVLHEIREIHVSNTHSVILKRKLLESAALARLVVKRHLAAHLSRAVLRI